MVIYLVIFLFSIVQSFFGIGLLLFGTPTLLLLNFSFEESLSYLLPTSLTINLLQLLSKSTVIDVKLKKRFFIWCLPFVALALFFRIKFNTKMGIELIVGVLLLFAAFIRTNAHISKLMSDGIKKYEIPFLVFLGGIHGISNMGGSFLSVYSSTKYQNKKEILGAISFCYLFFAISQLFILLIFSKVEFTPKQFLCVPLGAFCYLSIGKLFFNRVSETRYKNYFTAFIFVFAFLLISKHFGIL